MKKLLCNSIGNFIAGVGFGMALMGLLVNICN